MILEIPKYPEDTSSLELVRMIEPFEKEEGIVFHKWDRYDYSYLVETREKQRLQRLKKEKRYGESSSKETIKE